MKPIKLTRGRFKGHTVELAPQHEVAALPDEIQRVLDALGHPEALVTDESRIGDFFDFGDPEPPDTRPIAAALGVPVDARDFIVDVALRLRPQH